MSARWFRYSMLPVSVLVLSACLAQPTPQVLVVTVTPLPAVPTAAVQYVIITATPMLPTETPIAPTGTPTATPVPPTAVPVVVISATKPPPPPVQVPPSPTPAAAGYIYPPPSLSGTCGSTLTPGDFVLDILFLQGLKEDEFFDIRARPTWELEQPGWRGVAVTKETHYVIPGRGTRYQYSFINNPWERGTYFLSVAVIRRAGDKWAGQLSPESNTCALQW